MDFTVEKEISQDVINQIYLIAKDYTKDYFTKNFPDDMRIDMQFQRAALLKNGSEVISCIVFTCLDGSLHITLMATKRDYNNKGYGKLLMKHFVAYASELGINSIELFTFSKQTKPINISTINFYEKVGFKIEKVCKDLWGNGTIVLKMRKSW